MEGTAAARPASAEPAKVSEPATSATPAPPAPRTPEARAAAHSTAQGAAAPSADVQKPAPKSPAPKSGTGKAPSAKAPAAKAAGTTARSGTAKSGAGKPPSTKAGPPKTPAADAGPAKTGGAKTGGPAKAGGAGPARSPRTRKATAAATGATGANRAVPKRRATSAPKVKVRPAPPLDATDRERLLAGAHHDPHGMLGAHLTDEGVVFRALRPHATSVTVVAGGLEAELISEGDGLFAAVAALREIPDYRLRVRYGTDEPLLVDDPYRMLPALGGFDLHLISEGRHEELWRVLGAHPMTHQGVTGTRFTVWAPNARGVRVTGDFTFWDGTACPMRSLGSSGVWELFLPGIGEGTVYKFDVCAADGTHTMRADPMARRTECPPNTASVVHTSRYEWHDADWLARRGSRPIHEAPFSVYEVHLGSWRPGLGFRELAEQLPAYVRDLGFTHVELLPVAEHPFGGSWGYQITGYYAPTARLGTPDDFKYLVDRLHQEGIGVLVDWVPAHFPKDDWALARFDGTPLYEHPDPRRAEHPDWGTLEFDYGRNEVRNFLVANATYWCEEFHVDGLRVDAVASMLYLDYSREDGEWSPNEFGGRDNPDAVAFLQEMNATVYRRCPGVVTIAEESTAWDGVTRPTDVPGQWGIGGLGFGLKWNMGWMHDSLVYMSKDPIHRRYHHNEMTFSMVYAYSENYVLPISHDEVVHGKGALVSKMPGDWWQQRANHRAYLGFMWSHPGKQLLFMGQEFAQGAEWSEAHGPDWWLLDPSYSAEPDHRGVRDLVRELNTVYGRTPSLWERDCDPSGFAWITADAADDNVLAFLRYSADGTPLLVVSNFSPVVRHDYRLGVPDGPTAWRPLLNTDDKQYGGSGLVEPCLLYTSDGA
ncbi:1,4-alpha-glucan branching enzyme, partial [Streptomyces sp. OF1]|nr:1,4-alpha-glucan branching enzyme [Streptomyces alkaliterrae]